MELLAALKSFARAWLHRDRMEREMDAEMRFHVEARAADLVAQGLSRIDAERRARQEFGSVAQWKDAGRDARGLSLVDDLGADLRYAVRTMRRSPTFTVAAIVSLTLGIGANTAIFGLIDQLLLKPIAVRNPQELVHITTGGERGDANSGSSNYPWFTQVAAHTDLLSDAMLVRHDIYKVGIAGKVDPIPGQSVTANYYSLLGVPPLLGRTFVPSDQPENAGPPVAVISYDLWQRRFGGAANVIGESITVDQKPYTIIGVTPADFRGILVGWTMDVTMLLDRSEFMEPNNWRTMPLIARVRPGVDPARIAAQLTPQLQRIAAGTTERFRRRYLQRVSVESAAQGITDLRAPFARPLRLLMGAVGLLLVIACVNLAGLQLARNAARQHELAMRLTLGARRARIVRQLLTESALLAVLGAVPGVVLAILSGNMLIALLPQYFGPVSIAVTGDVRLIGFAVGITVATTLLFGLIPAWQAARDGVPAGAGRATRTSVARLPVGRTLVAAQFALSVVLVAGAMLVVRTLLNLSHVQTGFDRSHVLVVEMDPQGTPYERERLRAFQREMLAALARLPGVEHVTLSTSSPFNGNVNGRGLTVPGFVPRDADDMTIQVNLIGPEYFAALQIPLLAGRPIDSRDDLTAAPAAVVSESFARRYFGDARAAIGRQFAIGRADSSITYSIAGVAREGRYQDLRTASERLVYVPWFQDREIRLSPFEFVIRTAGDPANSITAARREIERLHPGAPILSIRTMTDVINGRLLSERLLAAIGSFFAIVALTLAALGVYGLLSHIVARRVPEIGVRMAIGAHPIEMVWMTLREILMLAAIGVGIGIAAAITALRVLEGLLFELSSTDTVNLMTAALVLLLVSIVAAFVPARRAASVDPLVALRSE